MPSAIDPDAIPGKDLDPDTVEAQAATITSIAASVRDNGSQVHLKWQGMAGVYSAPEAGTLLGLMQPVSSQATATGDNLDAVSAALTQFAADVRPIKAELDALRLSAQEFRDEIAGGVSVRELNPEWTTQQAVYGTTGSGEYSGSWNAYGATTSSTTTTDVPKYQTVTKQWHESQEHVDRNNELISAVNAQQVALWEAERSCANKIRSLYGGAALHAFQSENDPHGYGLDEIPEGTEMPWGAEVERTESCGEAAVNFVVKDFLWEGLIVGGVWGTIQGLGTLTLGYNPATGEWFSGDAYGAAWGNLGLLVASGVMNSPVLAPILWADQGMEAAGAGGFLPDEIRDFKAQADEAALNTGKALIAWDKWADDPGTALGESVFNVGTALIPVGGAAVASVKTASAAASVISKMARVVDLVDPGAWAFNGITRLGGAGLGSLDNLIGNLSSKIDPPHIEVYAATDSASALDALADWGVDPNTVTARIEDGVPVLEAPGVRVELPAGAFNEALSGVRGGDGVTDASIPAPVREPELVNAGGVRGETGPGPMNSIVDEAPVRTETGGPGESTIVREPETTTGSGGGASGQDEGLSSGEGAGSDGISGSDLDGAGTGGSGGGGDIATPGAADEPGDVAWRSSEQPDLTLTHPEKAAVDEYLATSRGVEPAITADMTQIVDAHPGMRLEGLEFRLKGDESMYRKVSDALTEALPGSRASVDSVLGQMKDSVRYTVVIPADDYARGATSVIQELIDDGYQPYGTLKNSWGGEGYQGINSNWLEPSTGRIIEVQFHTDSSFAAKMETHELYELERLPGQAPDLVAELQRQQNEIFDGVEVPPGAADVDWPTDDGSVAPQTPIRDAITAGSDPMHSGAPGVRGEWMRGTDLPTTPKDLGYGQPVAAHGTSTLPPHTGAADTGWALLEDPSAPFGADGGTPLTQAEYDRRYVHPGTNWDNYPPNDGAVRGTRVEYVDGAAFVRDYGSHVDRVGEPGGKYLGLQPDGVAATFEERGLPVGSLGYKLYDYELTGLLPRGWKIEISEIAPAFGQRGGGFQLLIRDEGGVIMTVDDLLDRGVLK